MAFDVTDVPPSTNPRVSIAFSGQIVLKPGPNNTCQIGVNKLDRNHIFQVVLVISNPYPVDPDVVKKAYHPATVIPLFTGPVFAPFLIRLQPDPFPADVGNFRVFARNPFDRTRPNSHDLDYRWAVNFKDLHLNLSTNHGIEPVGTLKTGVLYTPRLTDPGLHPRLVRQSSPDFRLNQIASNLAVSITLPTEQTRLLFQWEDEGEAQELVLPRSGDDSRTLYTLYFINEPPNLNAQPHDEFALYYRALLSGGASIPDDQRFELETDPIVRSDEIPCMPVILNP